VHAEADRLEHVISEDLEERIAQALGDPVYDPHGEPIPSREFKVPLLSNVRLSDLRPGDRAVVQYLGDTNPELLRYLRSIGLIPNCQLTILDHSPLDDTLHLQIAGQEAAFVLGPRITQEIYVELA
jgi:DtxR family Mn-dependent transcriptional regulator